MKKIIQGLSIDIILFVIIAYLLMNAFGYRPIITVEKLLVIVVLSIIALNMIIYIVGAVKKGKVLNIVISSQLVLVIAFMCFILIKNYNTNMYLVRKNDKDYMMCVNVNDDTKEYYLLKNKYIRYKDFAIKEYLKDTTLSYNENSLSKIKYNKNILKSGVNKEVIETEKKIISSKKIEDTTTRVCLIINNKEELTEFCKNYEVDVNYDTEFFNENSLVIVSYVPYKEVIPYIALGEDYNLYVYIKKDSESELEKNAFCFMEWKKENGVEEIIVEDYDKVMKNYEI